MQCSTYGALHDLEHTHTHIPIHRLYTLFCSLLHGNPNLKDPHLVAQIGKVIRR